MMDIAAHSPRWANSECTAIELVVKFPWIANEVPFTADHKDIEPHGREIFALAVAGTFGPVAEYVAPTPQPAAVPKSATSLQFMDRFTEAEQLAIVTATMTVPAVKLWYDRMIAATEVVYADPRVLAGLNALVGAGLLQAARVDEILPVAWR